MKRWTFKSIESLDLRIPRHMQRAHAGDDDSSIDGLPIAQRRVPHSGGFIPHRLAQYSFQTNLIANPVALNRADHVFLNLLAPGQHPAPLWIQIERKGIEVRRNIARA